MYHSTYVFVTRENASLQGLTLDDERLRSLKIGVQMIGNDAMNTPPAHSLSRRGIVDNVRGYSPGSSVAARTRAPRAR
jgi:mxaJ protein